MVQVAVLLTGASTGVAWCWSVPERVSPGTWQCFVSGIPKSGCPSGPLAPAGTACHLGMCGQSSTLCAPGAASQIQPPTRTGQLWERPHWPPQFLYRWWSLQYGIFLGPVGGPVWLAFGVALWCFPFLGGITLAFSLGGCVTFAGFSPLGLPWWGYGLGCLLGLALALGGGLFGRFADSLFLMADNASFRSIPPWTMSCIFLHALRSA